MVQVLSSEVYGERYNKQDFSVIPAAYQGGGGDVKGGGGWVEVE